MIKIVDYFVNRRLRFGYDIGRGFVVAEEELLHRFDRIKMVHEEVAEELKKRLESTRLEVIRSLGKHHEHLTGSEYEKLQPIVSLHLPPPPPFPFLLLPLFHIHVLLLFLLLFLLFLFLLLYRFDQEGASRCGPVSEDRPGHTLSPQLLPGKHQTAAEQWANR